MPDYHDPFGEFDHIKALPMAEAVASAKKIEVQIHALQADSDQMIPLPTSTSDSRKAIQDKISILENEMKLVLIRSALAT